MPTRREALQAAALIALALPAAARAAAPDDCIVRVPSAYPMAETIARLEGYLHMADWGTCATDWPLLDEWEQELAQGTKPN